MGGSIVGYDNGAWQKSMDMNLSNGSIHVGLVLDMDSQTGTLSYDQYDAINSGSVDLDPITEGDVSFDRIWLTLRTSDETMGYDNIIVDYLAPEIPGDANGDGLVNDTDGAALAANWQQSNKAWADGDFNADGWVDDADASIMAANWGYGASEATAVPEPSGIVLWLCVAALAALRRRR